MFCLLKRYTGFAVSAAVLLASAPAQASNTNEVEALRNEIQLLRKQYEDHIADLEARLAKIEASKVDDKQQEITQMHAPAPVTTGSSPAGVNSFNPAISVILNGKYSHFSNNTSEIAGFGIGEEGERGKSGFAVDESELNFSANVDDKFRASLTASIVNEDGSDQIGLEEAYFQTLSDVGLPLGMNLKVGRAYWTLGYLNEHHTHADDFADRPLPYRVYLNNGFNDDGAALSYVLPTDLYTEVGAGVFRGDDYPFGNAAGNGIGAWSAYARVGGDMGDDQSWRIGGYVLSGDARNRSGNGDTVSFTGDSKLYVADFRYTWAPAGNPYEKELTLQGEYMRRDEKGSYEDAVIISGPVSFDDTSSGWYAQAVYKFHPQWRVGLRYSQMMPADVPAGLTGSVLDARGNDPHTYSLMADWTNSEFSRLRLQFNREEVSAGERDNQFLLQYIMIIGAHGAHKY